MSYPLFLRRVRPSRIAAWTAVAVCGCSSADAPDNPLSPSPGGPDGQTAQYAPQIRNYYVAAEPVDWSYAPTGYDSVYARPVPSPWGDSLVYSKLRYIQYTDASFTRRVAQPNWLGILGPMIRGVVGDSIRVTFLNRTDRPLTIHPHGVSYLPEDEGAQYNPPRGGGDGVLPGQRYTYRWFASPEAGPLPGEPSSKVWLYHSHVMDSDEILRGLVGTIVITDAAKANQNGTPKDVDREFVTLWLVWNENTLEDPPDDVFETNLKHAINGRFFGNLQGYEMNLNDRVRWYLVALGTEIDMHTPHWHGNRVKLEGRTYTDVVELGPASMHVADMVASQAGRWLLHCHVADHFDAGMFTLYTVRGTLASSYLADPTSALTASFKEADSWYGLGR